MAAPYTTLTAEQKEAIMSARNDQSRELTGMVKWDLSFTDGKGCTMLSDQCKNREEALYAAIERFGAKVCDVKG